MAEDIRLWEIQDGKSLNEIEKSKLDQEARLEDWLEKDINLISSDLLVIGSQVKTIAGPIDLLCLDSEGDCVIVELKRDRTPREVTAQALDYASCVKDFSHEKISEIANTYLGERGPLESAFRDKFEQELPDTLNESHKSLIVSSEIDDSTERIINYLSESNGIAINAIKFQYFRGADGKEYMARIFLIDPETIPVPGSSKRNPPLTFEQLTNLAKENGVLELFILFEREITPLFDRRVTTRSTVCWVGLIQNSNATIMNVIPSESSAEKGLHFYVYIDRLAEYLNIKKEELMKCFPKNIEEGRNWNVNKPAIFGYFSNVEEIRKFVTGLNTKTLTS